MPEARSLPLLATAADVREVVRFLKRHTDGITIVQAMDAFRKRVFEPRKIAAYEFWGIISRNSDRLRLTELGWDFAKRLAPEAELYSSVLKQTEVYQSTVAWIYKEGLKLVTHLDVTNFWRQEHPELLDSDTQEEAEARVTSFFHLCHAAEIGMLTVGRKGQPTRLHIYRDDLKVCLRNTFSINRGECDSPVMASGLANKIIKSEGEPTRQTRVFISNGQTVRSLYRITVALDLAEFGIESIEENGKERTGLSETLDAMRQCDAGILVVNRNHYSHQGQCSNEGQQHQDYETFLMQLGAAIQYFRERLILLLQKKVVLPKEVLLPSGLGAVTYYEFDEDVSWELAVEIVKSIKRAQHSIPTKASTERER